MLRSTLMLTLLSILVPILTLRPATAEPTQTSEAAVSDIDTEDVERHLRGLEHELNRQIERVERASERDRALDQLAEDLERLERHFHLIRARLKALTSPRADTWLEELSRLELRAQELRGGAARPGRPMTAGEALPRPNGTLDVSPADACGDAPVIGDGIVMGDTSAATTDGSSSCDGSEPSSDVWYRYLAPASGTVVVAVAEANFGVVVSVHEDCPGTDANEVACRMGDDPPMGNRFEAVAGEDYLIRVVGTYGGSGTFTLNVGRVATLSGTVTNAGSGAAIAGTDVTIWNVHGTIVEQSLTDALGRYAVTLAPDTYFATATREGFVGEAWDDVPCSTEYRGCDLMLATPIELASGEVRDDVDFALDFGATISGTVRDATTGDPISYVDITLSDADGLSTHSADTDDSGSWSIGGLPGGTYFATTRNFNDYLDELWDDMPCPFGSCTVADGTPIAVTVDTVTSGIDFELRRLGSISGIVTDATTGDPIVLINVEVRSVDGAFFGSDSTYDDGGYSVGGLPPGDYYVRTSNYDGYQDEFFDDVVVCASDDPAECGATPVTVVSDQTMTDVDFALFALGKVSGHARDELTGAPVTYHSINFFDATGYFVGSATTDEMGNYETRGLLPGTHFAVATESDGYFPEIYDDVPCGDSCDVLTGTPIPVELVTTTSGIDFDLTFGGTITGLVTDAVTGQPISYARVQLWNEETSFLSASTDSDGRYTFFGLTTGTYFAAAADGNGFYVSEIFDNVPCNAAQLFDCDPRASGDPIAVTVSAETSGIDFSLRSRGAITGTVTDEFSGSPIASANVQLWDARGNPVAYASSDYEGHYTVQGLDAGTYFATAERSGYLPELYDGMTCDPGNPCADPTLGTPITLRRLSTVTDVDFTLSLESGLAGTVTAEGTGVPLAGVYVDVWVDPAYSYSRVMTNDAGRYSVSLPAGVYFVSTDNQLGAVDEVYDDVACPEGSAHDGLCDVLQGRQVIVRRSAVRAGIDFALSGISCPRTDTALCLNDSRFRVEVAWRTPMGATGSGQAVELTADSGYFWFFNSDNVELVIKVLDGCFAPFDTFWVFAAGLTNVEVDITVTDTFTATVKTYRNPLGTPFQPILDTGAFATCDAVPRAGLSVSDRDEPVANTLALPDAQGGMCVTGGGDLCLNDQRFLVEIFWATQDGTTGQGQAVPLTNDTGFFWFFNSDNVEVVVKVLDACQLGSFNSFWVFAAGLTNVEARLRVTDTATGVFKEYFRSLGTPFQPILDTSAFPTCP